MGLGLLVGAGLVRDWDLTLDRWLAAALAGPLDPMGEVLGRLLRGELVLGAALLAAAAAWRLGRRWLALALLLVLPLTAVEIVGKYTIPTPRPGETVERDEPLVPELPSTPRLALRTPHYYPSGHSARLMFIAGLALALSGPQRRPAVTAAVLALVVLGALTRVTDGSHLPSEVVGGVLLAIAFLGPAVALIELDRQAPARRSAPGQPPPEPALLPMTRSEQYRSRSGGAR